MLQQGCRFFPTVFGYVYLNEDNAFGFVLPDHLFRKSSVCQKFDGYQGSVLFVPQNKVGAMPIHMFVCGDGGYVLQQIFLIWLAAIGACPLNKKSFSLLEVFLQQLFHSGEQMDMEYRGTITFLRRFLEVGKMGALHFAAIAGNDSVSTLGAGVNTAFLGFVYMYDISLLIVSQGV